MKSATQKNFLKIKEVAEQCSVSVSTIRRWVQLDPTFPQPIKIGPRLIRFRQSDVKEWINEQQ